MDILVKSVLKKRTLWDKVLQPLSGTPGRGSSWIWGKSGHSGKECNKELNALGQGLEKQFSGPPERGSSWILIKSGHSSQERIEEMNALGQDLATPFRDAPKWGPLGFGPKVDILVKSVMKNECLSTGS